MVGLLIRHGHADAAGKELVDALKWLPISAVYSSPLESAVETAHPLACDHGLDLRVRPALTDIDSGADGESRAAVQQRIVDELMMLAKSHPGETIAIVTHAEPIRCALAALAGETLDDTVAIEIAPGHVSSIGIQSDVRRVLGVNLPASDVTV